MGEFELFLHFSGVWECICSYSRMGQSQYIWIYQNSSSTNALFYLYLIVKTTQLKVKCSKFFLKKNDTETKKQRATQNKIVGMFTKGGIVPHTKSYCMLHICQTSGRTWGRTCLQTLLSLKMTRSTNKRSWDTSGECGRT